jgi:cell division septation protein DedD
MQWQLWLMIGLLIAGWMGMSPDAQLPQAQWQTTASVAIPPLPTPLPGLLASTAIEPAATAKLNSVLSASVLLDLGNVNDLEAAQKLLKRLTAEKLRAQYTRNPPPEENTYRVWVGPYWSAMDAKPDVRSCPTLLTGAQVVKFLN